MTELLGTYTVSALARRALLRGAASAFDLRGDTRRQYLFARSPAEGDLRALRDDWQQVANDMWGALNAGDDEQVRA